MRSWRTLSRASLVAALSAAFLGAMAPAHANPVDGSFDSAIGAGSSSQHMRWKQPSQRVRLWVTFAGNPNSTGGRCQDAAVDWNTNGTGHYDARVLRNCNPGHTEQTDPGGDGWWEEPNNFDGANVTQVQRVGSYVFEDGNLSNVINGSNMYGSRPSAALA